MTEKGEAAFWRVFWSGLGFVLLVLLARGCFVLAACSVLR